MGFCLRYLPVIRNLREMLPTFQEHTLPSIASIGWIRPYCYTMDTWKNNPPTVQTVPHTVDGTIRYGNKVPVLIPTFCTVPKRHSKCYKHPTRHVKPYLPTLRAYRTKTGRYRRNVISTHSEYRTSYETFGNISSHSRKYLRIVPCRHNTSDYGCGLPRFECPSEGIRKYPSRRLLHSAPGLKLATKTKLV